MANQVNWLQELIDLIQAIISGVFVGWAVFWLDERRAKRERRLSDFRIASNWENDKAKPSLRNFDLANANMSGYKLKNANLEDANFYKAKFWGTNLESANLRRAIFRKASFVGADLSNSIAFLADFSGATIKNKVDPENKYFSDFTKASLGGAKFIKTKLTKVCMKNARLRGTDFSNAIVVDCDFSGADLTDSNWKKVKHVEECIWKNVLIDKPEKFPPFLLDEIQKQNAKKEV